MQIVCYLDESADDGPPPVSVVAGFAAYSFEWKMVEDAGAAILARYDVPLLHAKDLFRRKGIYKTWPTERVLQFATEVVQIVRSHALVGVIAGVDSERHKIRKDETGLSSRQSAYGSCFELINNAIVRAFAGLDDHRLLYRWETRGQKDREIRISLANITREHSLDSFLSGIEFVAKDSGFGVQMADFLAFLARRQAQAKLRYDEQPDKYYFVLEPLLDKVGYSFIATDMS